MAFRLKKDEFFTGTMHEPGEKGNQEHVLVSRGTRTAVVRQTVIKAECSNWDWVIELCRNTGDEDRPVEVLAHWSSVAGELPPVDRPENL